MWCMELETCIQNFEVYIGTALGILIKASNISK